MGLFSRWILCPASSHVVFELHPEEVLGLALRDVVDDVLVVEECRVLCLRLRHPFAVWDLRSANLFQLVRIRMGLS